MILRKLKEIEKSENVKILHAVEYGSRAWGFASPDSDYDVRFIYVRSREFYLRLQEKKDFIEWELNETLDIIGWDISKALQHFYKSNATLFEWSNSSIVYYTAKEWNRIKEISGNFFSCKSAMYHYYGTANKNYNKYLTEDMVKYKKYFYVLRPILACRWIEKKASPPPVLFQELMDEVLEDEMRAILDKLIEEKMLMGEAEKRERIDTLNEYIVTHLGYFKQQVASMENDRTTEWEPLNSIFLEILHV